MPKKRLRKIKKRTIYDMGILRGIVNRLGESDKRLLREMNRKLGNKPIVWKHKIKAVSGLKDWIAEYRQEGHIL